MFKAKRTRCLRHRTATALTPVQVAKAYNFPTGVDVSNKLVAILELGGAYNPQDVTNYCARYGIKQPQLSYVLTDGMTEVSDPSGADGEVCLDIDVIAAVAQGVKIVVVFAPNTDQGFIDGVKKCISLSPDSISISWGSPTSSWSSTSMASLDSLFLEAQQAGIMVFAAAGDNGSSDGASGNNVDYPASSPYVIGCGGTHLELNADGTRDIEYAWNLSSDGSGGGGGVSTNYAEPDFQKSVATLTGRGVPDISGNADPNTGYLVDIDGTIVQIGGTSAVAPLYAALCAVLKAASNTSTAWLTSIYANTGICFDVTSGNNGAYSCTPGYDMVTGVGVVDGTRFLDVITGKPLPTQPTPNPEPPSPTPPVSTGLWTKLVNFFKGLF